MSKVTVHCRVCGNQMKPFKGKKTCPHCLNDNYMPKGD